MAHIEAPMSERNLTSSFYQNMQAGPSAAHRGGSRQRTGTRSSSGAGSIREKPGAVVNEPAQAVPSRRGRRLPAPPGLEAQLAQLAQQYGCGRAALSQAVAALGQTRQAWFAEHSCDVAAWLSRQGVGKAQSGRLLLRCPVLFTWPVEQRAGVLFGQQRRPAALKGSQ